MDRLSVQLTPDVPHADMIVVVDVLRFTTSAACALAHGAHGIIPCETVEQARLAIRHLPTALLAGERHAVKPPGFHFGNSPHEFTRAAVQGRDIIWTTTNGTRAIVLALGTGALVPSATARIPHLGERDLLLASLVNLSAVVAALEFALRAGKSVVVVCSGREGGFALEDAACAGRLVRRLQLALGGELTVNDGARASACIDEAYGEDFARLFRDARHGRTLRELGFGADLDACGALDAVQTVPRWLDGRFVAR